MSPMVRPPFVVRVIRLFSTHRPTEIVSAPKVYGFDTGFVSYRGGQDLRREDLDALWEHFVLNEIMARPQSREVSYWRDKRGHEVAFFLVTRANDRSQLTRLTEYLPLNEFEPNSRESELRSIVPS